MSNILRVHVIPGKPIPHQLRTHINEKVYIQLIQQCNRASNSMKFNEILVKFNQENEWNNSVTGVQINNNRNEVIFDFIVGLGGLIGHVRPFYDRFIIFDIEGMKILSKKFDLNMQSMPNLVTVSYNNEVLKASLLIQT